MTSPRDDRAADCDDIRPTCPTCGGTGKVLTTLKVDRFGPKLVGHPPCPDCVDGRMTFERMAAIVNAVFGWERGSVKGLVREELWSLYGQWELLDHLQGVR